MQAHRWQPTRLHRPWDSPGKNTGMGCHFLLQCMKVKSEGEVAQLCLTLSHPMDCSLSGSSIHGYLSLFFPFTFFFFIPPQLLTLTNWANAGLSKNSTWQLSVWDCANALEQEAWILGQPPTAPIISLATVRDENLWAKTQGYISLFFPHPIKVQSSCSNE